MPILGMQHWGRAAGGLLAMGNGAELAFDARTVNRHSPSLSRAVVDPAPRTCGATGCSGSWNKSWKKRRPLFEDDWGCSSRCLQSMVRAAVRREAMHGTSMAEDGPHRHRVPLGLVLLAQRWITHPQLQAALEQQRTGADGRIGDLLIKNCGLTEDRITRGLALQWNCPVLTLEGFEPRRMALVMPIRLCTAFGLIPLRVAGSSLLYLASSGHMDASIALAVEQMSGLRVESGLLNESQMRSAQHALAEAPAVTEYIRSTSDVDDLVEQISKILESRQPVASRIVRVHGHLWLRLWLEQGALNGAGRVPTSTEDVEDYLFVSDSETLNA